MIVELLDGLRRLPNVNVKSRVKHVRKESRASGTHREELGHQLFPLLDRESMSMLPWLRLMPVSLPGHSRSLGKT